MSDKSVLYNILTRGGDTLEDCEQAYPELVVPDEPVTTLDAVMCTARASRQMVIWLNAYKGVLVRDAIKSMGAGCPAPAYLAMGVTTSQGGYVNSDKVHDAIIVSGIESEGGKGYVQIPIKTMQDTISALDLIGDAITLWPDATEIAALAPLWSMAMGLVKSPVRRIAEAIGLPLASQVLHLLVQYLYDRYIAPGAVIRLPDCVCEHLGAIVEELTSTSGNWYYPGMEPGEKEPVLKRMASVLTGVQDEVHTVSESISSDVQDEHGYVHLNDLYKTVIAVRDTLRALIVQEGSMCLEIGDNAFFLKSGVYGSSRRAEGK